jgi:hypothetical protein
MRRTSKRGSEAHSERRGIEKETKHRKREGEGRWERGIEKRVVPYRFEIVLLSVDFHTRSICAFASENHQE